VPAAYQRFHDFTQASAQHDPTNGRWQRDLAVSYDSNGDVLRAQGDLNAALAAFRKGLEIREHMAAHNPANSEWQRELSARESRFYP